jgi:DNA-binding NarL/FixJ family response regulator
VTVRVLVVDDEPLVRAGLQMILGTEPDIEVVGEAGDGREALDAVARLEPDVVLLDLRMPVMDGLETTRRLRAGHRGTEVVVLTTFDTDRDVQEALAAGACGYLLKDAPAERLTAALRAAAAGDAVLDRSVVRRVAAELTRRQPPAGSERLLRLTDREREVLGLMAEGLSNAEIAGRLVIGEGTVKTHVARVLQKLEVRDRLQAVVLAYRSGTA